MSFRFGNQFQYIATPPLGGDPDAPTTPGGTPIINSVVNSVPGNVYLDFSDDGNPTQTYRITVNDASFYGFRYYTYKNHNVDYSPPLLLTIAGAVQPSSNWTWKRTASTTNGTIVTVARTYSEAGKCSDTVKWYNSSTNIYQTTSYPHLVISKAVAVGVYSDLIDPDIFTYLAPNSVKNVSVGQEFHLAKNFSRGKEVSNSWVVLKTDPAGSFTGIPAIAGTDFAFVGGTNINSDEMHLQLLQPYNFEFRLTTVGYTFNNNPWQNFPSVTQPNTSTATYYFNTTVGVYNYEIKIPEIEFMLDVPPAVLLGTDPFETYQGQLITVTPELDLSTGEWKQINAVGPPSPVILTKTDEEWRAEITAKCDVILEARKKDTGELETTRVGLEPFTISLLQATNYNLQFVTTLK